ncbi:MAG: hypothetical protein MZV65_52815 [Chromatiales bacterium]|nr:hypothetical protein [Chromatiales bacterium]
MTGIAEQRQRSRPESARRLDQRKRRRSAPARHTAGAPASRRRGDGDDRGDERGMRPWTGPPAVTLPAPAQARKGPKP